MSINLRIATWNANGASNHIREIEIFLVSNHIDILLISETHFTVKTYFNIRGYDIIQANHPDGKAHAGSALLIKSSFKFETMDQIVTPWIQASGIKIKCDNRDVAVYSVYFPPRHTITCEDYENFFTNLGTRFIVGGDFNAKHPWWGSRVGNPKGKELYKCVIKKNYKTISTGKPTYWPSDPNKIPDLLDFFVCSGISSNLLDIIDCDDLSSDHTPIILNYSTDIQNVTENFKIITPKTDIKFFQNWMDQHLQLNISLKSGDEIDLAVEGFTKLIHEAALMSTPQVSPHNGKQVIISAEIRDLISNKRRLRRIWQSSRSPTDKTNFNKAANYLKKRISEVKNENLANFLRNLNSTNNNEYNLWKATKYLKKPAKRNIPIKGPNGTWCRSSKSKADSFSEHLEQIFQPFPSTNIADENLTKRFLETACQMDLPIKAFSPREVQNEISKLNNLKSPGHDKIDSKVAKSLSKKSVLFLTLIYNSILRLSHFPTHWKRAEIIMILKPNKPENTMSSYRPISLLPTFSKIFERLFSNRLLPFLEKQNIIPDHQFGFRHKHGTPEQCHRIVNVITDSLENKLYCSAVFLDVKQAFDTVWHEGLLYKLKKQLPTPYYLFLKSYLTQRKFYVKVNDDTSSICQINAGVPQGSVLGPVLYTIYTSDMPIEDNVTIATYADDTAILASDVSPNEASFLVQRYLNQLQMWLSKWKICINAEKSNHVLFTLKKGECPPLHINGSEIPKADTVKYLGMHLDKRLTWKNHITAKRDHLNIKTKKMWWLLGPKSELSLENKILLYKCILKPVWTYGLQLWGTTSNSNVEILQRYQSKTLRFLANAPWYMTNKQIHRDLECPFIKDEINRFSSRYIERLSNHSNVLAISLLDETEETRRLKRFHVLDLPYRK